MIDAHAQDTILYAAIAMLTVTVTLLADGSLDAADSVAIALSGLIAVKAKRSAGKTKQE